MDAANLPRQRVKYSSFEMSGPFEGKQIYATINFFSSRNLAYLAMHFEKQEVARAFFSYGNHQLQIIVDDFRPLRETKLYFNPKLRASLKKEKKKSWWSAGMGSGRLVRVENERQEKVCNSSLSSLDARPHFRVALFHRLAEDASAGS